VPRLRHQIRLPEACTDPDRPVKSGVRPGEVTLLDAAQPDGHEEVPLLHTVQLSFVDQPLGPGEPAAPAGHVAPEQQTQRQPERGPHLLRLLAATQTLLVRARGVNRETAVIAEALCRRRHLRLRDPSPSSSGAVIAEALCRRWHLRFRDHDRG
jgi:hypothetical protein